MVWASPQGFKMRLRNVSSPTNVGHHNPPYLGPNILVGTLSVMSHIGWEENKPLFYKDVETFS